MFPQNSLKGQQAISPGQRPGYDDMVVFALKGQKLWTEATPPTHSFALSRAGVVYSCLPRALPWADSSLPLRGVVEHTKSYQVII